MNINFTPAQTEFSYSHVYLGEYPFKGNMMMKPPGIGATTTGKSNFPTSFDSISSVYDQQVSDKNNLKHLKKIK